ncbi:MAG: hypothetical protein IT249_10725 [Chitinophagaceae bacterium]|nr:hypothetical protein [Chitinophagaceae bacterium]
MTENKLYNSALCLTLLIFNLSYGQRLTSNIDTERKVSYQNALEDLKGLLINDNDFLKGVFLVEQAYYKSDINYYEFEQGITSLAELVNRHLYIQTIRKYNQPDSLNYLQNHSIFSVLFDTLKLTFQDSNNKTDIVTFSYQYEDPFCKQDWTNMFVSKLLATGKGNCHSLSYLYKMVADKIGAKCWLALAPNHIYIKNFSQYFGWYNTELTSRSFPTDAWIMTTSYIHPNAVRSGLYMDTLSNQQSIALCILDLAKGYEVQTHNYYDGFILQCCDLVLQYHPVNPMALLLKAETLRKVYDLQNKEKKPEAVETYRKMEAAYIRLAKLYYREMPEKMYLQWLKTADNYNNKKLQ